MLICLETANYHMTQQEIARIIDGEILLPTEAKVHFGVASDLMSDVLTLDGDDIVLLTGLVNVQAIRTAEMADIPLVVFLRGKKVDSEIIEMAEEGGIGLIQCRHSLFNASGKLYAAGIKPMY